MVLGVCVPGTRDEDQIFGFLLYDVFFFDPQGWVKQTPSASRGTHMGRSGQSGHFILLVTVVCLLLNSQHEVDKWYSEHGMERPLRKKRTFSPAVSFWDSEKNRTECTPESTGIYLASVWGEPTWERMKESNVERRSEESQPELDSLVPEQTPNFL